LISPGFYKEYQAIWIKKKALSINEMKSFKRETILAKQQELAKAVSERRNNEESILMIYPGLWFTLTHI
jgi:hypothetical protein